MRRNLDRRVEAVTPIEDPNLKKRLEDLLSIYLEDNQGSWEKQSNGEFIKREANDATKNCSQSKLIDLWKNNLI